MLAHLEALSYAPRCRSFEHAADPLAAHQIVQKFSTQSSDYSRSQLMFRDFDAAQRSVIIQVRITTVPQLS